MKNPDHHHARVHGQKKNHPWLVAICAVLLFLVLYLFSSLSNLRIFLPYYPQLTGLPFSSKNYLIVFQNNDELRPGGGFISAYGFAEFHNGIFAGLSVQDVYGPVDNHPYMDPPYPMKQLLANQWYTGYNFRDANYNADFPTTANELVRMIHLTQPNLNIDGVIAVNYSFLEDLLAATGPIQVDNETFSKDSLFQLLEYDVNDVDRHNVTALQNRKNVLKDFAQALIKKIVFSPLKLRQVCDTVVHSLQTKEIQMYFNNTSLENMVADNGWSGAWPGSIQGDFLAVVEANLGGLKSDRYIQRTVQYHVSEVPDQVTGLNNLIAEVTVNIDHYGVENIPLNGQYTGFYRIYAPLGSQLLDSSNSATKCPNNDPQGVWQSSDSKYSIFGNVVCLAPGEKTTLYYKYQLPQTVLNNNEYQLYIPKQSGANQDFYTVIFQAPQGFDVLSPNFTEKENAGIYQTTLSSDAVLSLQVVPDNLPPNVIYQNIDALNKITIVFNEDVSNSTAEDPLNYQLTDLNVNHLPNPDNVQLDHIEHQGKTVTLYTKNMSKDPNDQYQITMKDISNSNGNVIAPNPKTITVVQRL